MQLFILRHGQAEPQKTTDDLRNLTPKGRADVAAMTLRSLDDLKCIDLVWISPLVRAQQTAQIAIDLLAQSRVIPHKITTDLIVPEADPAQLFDALLHVKQESVLLVSHQPLVSRVLDLLCGSPAGTHAMDTSSLACIDCDIPAAGLGRLRWLRHIHG